MPPSPRVQARLLMQAIALLHARGFGRLRPYGYVMDDRAGRAEARARGLEFIGAAAVG